MASTSSAAVAGGGGGGARATASSRWRWVPQDSTEEEDEEAEVVAGGGAAVAVSVGSGGSLGFGYPESSRRGGSYESEDEEDDKDGQETGEDEGDEDGMRRRLIRTAPTIDWFDVEAMEVTGATKPEDEDFNIGRAIVLALQTLAVVFGDIGTSPLYTFDVMFNKYPIQGEEDVLGALSLVIYTLILIPLIKYVLIVLWGNDDGEGGTFALYSLICRNAKVSLIPNQLPSDVRISSFRLKVPTPELERSIKFKECVESSLVLKKLLLGLVLFGTAMVISDGVVTPSMSVWSAVSGLKVGIMDFSEDKVVMISVAFLIILFSVQRYATSKVGFALGPLLFLWFCSLGGIGVYNLVTYGSTAFKAFNPLYILYYFERSPFQAFLSLGGCLLCAAGSEAIFADLLYFPLRYVQVLFLLLVLPCLLLGYLGQAAFLIANQNISGQIFYSSIPSGALWPVLVIANLAALIASRTMVTATFSCIKKSIALGCFPRLKIVHVSRKFMGHIYIPFINWFLLISTVVFILFFASLNEIGNAYAIAELGVMITTTILVTIIMILIWQTSIFSILCFAIAFLGLELIFFSSALISVGDGSWVLLVLAAVFLIIMNIWNYGSKLRYECEVNQKLSKDLLRKLGPNLGTVRAPGLGLVCNELVKGVPAVFGHFLTSLPAIHSMVVFVCIKYVPVSFVPQSERFIFQRVGPRSYHMFRCIARYGYKEMRKEHHQVFELLLISGLEKFIRREAVEISLESEDDIGSDEEEAPSVAPTNGSIYSLDVPFLSDYASGGKSISEPSTSKQNGNDEQIPDHEQNLELELSFIELAKNNGVTYLMGNNTIRARKESWFFRKLIINYFYKFLRNNCRRGITTMSIPNSNLLQVRMTTMV